MQPNLRNEPVIPSAKSDDFVLSSYHENRHHASLGRYGENYAKQRLLDSGYFVRFATMLRFQGDLWTMNPQTLVKSKIEVKTAYSSDDGQYTFCLRKQNKTDICYSDYIILICIDRYYNHFVYCIPCHAIGNITSLKIASHPSKYRGKYARFRVHGQVNLQSADWIAAQ